MSANRGKGSGQFSSNRRTCDPCRTKPEHADITVADDVNCIDVALTGQCGHNLVDTVAAVVDQHNCAATLPFVHQRIVIDNSRIDKNETVRTRIWACVCDEFHA